MVGGRRSVKLVIATGRKLIGCDTPVPISTGSPRASSTALFLLIHCFYYLFSMVVGDLNG